MQNLYTLVRIHEDLLDFCKSTLHKKYFFEPVYILLWNLPI